MCCQRDETGMESGLHALDMPTTAGHEHKPSANDESVPTRRCARWLSRLNGWTASAVDLEQGGGGSKVLALTFPNDGGNRFYVSAKFAFRKLWPDHANRRPGDLGFPQNSYSWPQGKHPRRSAFKCEENPPLSLSRPGRPITRCNSVGTTVGTTEARNNKAPNYGALRSNSGGESGIRTLGTVARTTDFESVPFDHSGNSPSRRASYQHSRAGRKPYGSCTPKRWATSS